MDTEELTEEMERKFLTIMHKNVIPILNEEESDALKQLAGQYITNKKHLTEMIDEFGEVVEENEVINTYNKFLFRIFLQKMKDLLKI